jgi:hypothetical protein
VLRAWLAGKSERAVAAQARGAIWIPCTESARQTGTTPNSSFFSSMK